MTDIRTSWDADAARGVWSADAMLNVTLTDESGNSLLDEVGRPISGQFHSGSGLVAGEDLITALLISLFTDASADADDPLPDNSSDRRGWWAGPIGSKLWLRRRMKANETTRALIEDDVRTALQWMVDDGVASTITVSSDWVSGKMLGVQVMVERLDGSPLKLRFAQKWEQI